MLRLFAPGRPARRFVLLIVLVAALGALAAVVWQWRSGPSDGVASPSRAVPNTDVSPFGANFFLMQEVEEWKSRKTLQMAREAGIVWAKQQFSWEEIQPQAPTPGESPDRSYSWEKADKVVSLFREYGLEIIARLDRPPKWALAAGTSPGPLLDNDLYGDFVEAFVSRYKGQISYIQVWNEPNLAYEWGNRPPSPIEYVALLKTAYQRARVANPDMYVLSAPLAPTLEISDRAMSETAFLTAMYEGGAAPYFDILSANAFGFGWPPNDPAKVDKLNYSRVTAQRAVMVQYGDGKKAVWFNEFGWNASPEGKSNDWYVWQRVSETDQAQYAVDAIELARKEWPWVGVLNLWYFRQVGTITSDRSEYYFRIVDVDFTPRLVYHAVKELAASQGVTGAGYFEETNPGLSSRGQWSMVRDDRASGGAYLAPQSAGASLSLAFRGQGLELILTRGAVQGRLHVTIDGREANGVPLSPDGKALVALTSASAGWQQKVTVATGLLQGAHTAQITYVSDAATPTPGMYPVLPAQAVVAGQAGIDGFVVSGAGREMQPFLLAGGASAVAAVAALALLVADGRARRRSARSAGGSE